ncbi:MAG: methyltransferase domain-containing protein [Acidobacteria bacterium]|nr:methyltransferase domain-containing protein [Acidobacteriota bacterium]
MVFLRKPSLEQLPVAMSGVRMGERALQIGIADPAVAGAIAAKVGLSGHAAIAVNNNRDEAKARAAAVTAGALIDVQVTPLDSLPFASDDFDAVVLHAAAGALPSLENAAGLAMLRESHRVLRSGGRIVLLEGGPRRGLGAWLRFRPGPPRPGAAVSALGAAGFRAARPIAEREGYRFTEGLK